MLPGKLRKGESRKLTFYALLSITILCEITRGVTPKNVLYPESASTCGEYRLLFLLPLQLKIQFLLIV